MEVDEFSTNNNFVAHLDLACALELLLVEVVATVNLKLGSCGSVVRNKVCGVAELSSLIHLFNLRDDSLHIYIS